MVFRTHGGPDVLECVEVSVPEPGPREVRIRVRACGVNHLDLDIRAGVSRFQHPLPHVLGREVAGAVDAVGDDIDNWAIGDAVVLVPTAPCLSCSRCLTGESRRCVRPFVPGISTAGGYGDYVVAPFSALLPLPSPLSFGEGAATPISFGTAWHMLVTLAAIRPGETVLVTGAAGGLGLAAVQMAALCGAQVIAAAGTPTKLHHAREAGAAVCIDYRSESVATAVHEATDGRGADVVVESVGGAALADAVRAAAVGARIITAGAHAGEIVPLDLVDFFRRELRLLGARGQSIAEIEAVLALVAKGKLRPKIDRILPLERAGEAHQLLHDRAAIGKLVLEP